MSSTDFNQKQFIKDVRVFMKMNKLSCRKFAKLSRISFVTLYRLENGENEMKISTMKKLEKAMRDYVPS